MPNVHTPERQPNETQAEYRARQALSRQISKTTSVFHDSQQRGTYVSGKNRKERRAAGRDNGQHPKFDRERSHKQHEHHQRDSNGAFTFVGREPRRQWLAGVSAQRGY